LAQARVLCETVTLDFASMQKGSSTQLALILLLQQASAVLVAEEPPALLPYLLPLLATEEASGFGAPPPADRPRVGTGASSAPPAVVDRRTVLTTVPAAVAASAALASGAAPAVAESTLVTRQQAYTRYVPRVERARDYWGTVLRKQIGASDWAAINKALEPIGKKGKGGSIMQGLGPMRLYASSFSGKTIADKTTAMNAALDELEDAVKALTLAADGKEKDGGLLGIFGAKKTLDEGSRKKLAEAAYKKGVGAFNKYILISNDGLGLNFAPLDTID